MKYEYSKEHKITYSETDNNLKLSLVASMNLAQDMMTNYFQMLKSGNDTNRSKHNAVWVLTKSKVHFINFPKLFETIKCNCNTTVSKMVRIGIESIFLNENNEKMFIISQECCPIDFETRKIRKINTISYPDNLEVTEATIQDPFSKMKTSFEEKDFVKNIIVEPTDIDFSNHTNNVSYIRYIMNVFETKFWSDKFITNFEIHYINESREGEKLSIYKVNIDDNVIEVLIKNEEKEIIRAKIECRKKELK